MSPGSAGEARYEGRKGHKWVHPPGYSPRQITLIVITYCYTY